MDWRKVKQGLLGAVVGAVVLMIIGFTWGGWVTGIKAQRMAADAAERAVVKRLAAICVVQSNQDPAKDQKVKKIKELDTWVRGDYVGKQGWATMPGDDRPDNAVSTQCGTLLLKPGG